MNFNWQTKHYQINANFVFSVQNCILNLDLTSRDDFQILVVHISINTSFIISEYNIKMAWDDFISNNSVMFDRKIIYNL